MATDLTPEEFRAIVAEVIDDRFNGTIEAMKAVARMKPDIAALVELREPLTQIAAAAEDLFKSLDYTSSVRRKQHRRTIMWQELGGLVSWVKVPGSLIKALLIAGFSGAIVHLSENGTLDYVLKVIFH